MLSSNISPDPIHFEGDWTEPETAMVETAVAEAEECPLTDQETAPWIAVSHAGASADMYAISRVGFPKVVTAQSVTALAEEIRELDLSGTAHPLLPTDSGPRRI